MHEEKTEQLIIGFTHQAQEIGGPGTFQTRLIVELEKRNWRVVYPEDRIVPDVVLVVGGSGKIGWLLWCKWKGSQIVHRLDGINWRHRVLKCSVGYKIKSEARNWVTFFIRNYLADRIVYQSNFVMDWWNSKYDSTKAPSVVIHNLVDLNEFQPAKKDTSTRPFILCAESQVVNDPVSRLVVNMVSTELFCEGQIGGIRMLGGLGVEEEVELSSVPGVELIGRVPRNEMPRHYREADIFLNLDVNAACPNAVIEALASGLPVVGFNTGALRELVPDSAGALVDYGGNPWSLDEPDCKALVGKIKVVISNLEQMSKKARETAQNRYEVGKVVDRYQKALLAGKVIGH